MAIPLCAVVGYGPGIGAAVAAHFAAAGFMVLGLTCQPLRHAHLVGFGTRLAPLDASRPESLAAALPQGCDVLIYNAYRSTPALPSRLRPAALLDDMAVNVAGALAAAQAVLPGMRARGRGSILMTGGAPPDPAPGLLAASLAAGRAALRSLAIGLHAELTPEGIHAGMVTLSGIAPATRPGTAPGVPAPPHPAAPGFTPERVAEAFWSLHMDAAGAFRREIIVEGR